MPMSKQVRQTRIDLSERFPLAFFGFGHAKLPLKIGIIKDIFDRCPDLNRQAVRRAIWDYTKGLTYATAMTADMAYRVDLDGDYAGIVADAESKPYRFAAWATHGNRLMYAALQDMEREKAGWIRLAETRRQERDALAEQAVKDGNEIERLRAELAAARSHVCGACGQPWTGESCGQKDNGHPFATCYPVPREYENEIRASLR